MKKILTWRIYILFYFSRYKNIFLKRKFLVARKKSCGKKKNVTTENIFLASKIIFVRDIPSPCEHTATAGRGTRHPALRAAQRRQPTAPRSRPGCQPRLSRWVCSFRWIIDLTEAISLLYLSAGHCTHSVHLTKKLPALWQTATGGGGARAIP